MITGAHFLLYSTDPEADRGFFRDVLAFDGVDAGGGWLIFKLPPAELAVHPSEAGVVQQHAGHDLLGTVLYLMCDDLPAALAALQAHKVSCTTPRDAEWGRFTLVQLPSGGRIGLYQPRHPTAIGTS